MCGILGFASKTKLNQEIFSKSLSTLAKRGPDAQGVYTDQLIGGAQITLGNTRLAVIDLSDSANQPLTDESGSYTIVFNGEIYNFGELKKELAKKGHRFRTSSDTEVLLRGYIEHGPKIVEKLKGMFAFAVYDQKEQTIFCARDHFGKKPFYYFLDQDRFALSSEPKALFWLLHKRIKPDGFRRGFRISQTALREFLIYGYIPSPRSFYTQIHKLPPATALIFDLKAWRVKRSWRFWQLEKIGLNPQISLRQAVEKLDALLGKSVKTRLISDVPLGSFLSGGIDSGLVTAIASRHTSNLDTFNVVCEDEEFDEKRFAQLTSSHLGVKPHFFHFHDKDVLSTLKKVLEYMDEPFADAALLPTAFLSEQTRRHVTVGLSGDGGDEIFGGYPKYNAQLLTDICDKLKLGRLLQSLPPTLRYLPLAPTAKESLRKFLQTLGHDLPSRHFILGSGGFTLDEMQLLLKDVSDLKPNDIFADAFAYADSFQQADLGNKLLYLDLMLQLPDGYLAKVDRASMSQSLEVRSPLLDKDLVEFVFSLPSRCKFDLFHNKILLKTLASNYLPREIVTRPKKGFGVPLNRWVKTELRDLIEAHLFTNPLGILDEKYIKKIWRELLEDQWDHTTKIWRIFILNIFLKKHPHGFL